jgi:hypothetical protein
MLFDLATFTAIHTILSLIALLAGVVVVIGLLGAQSYPFWTSLFLITAIATSVTGYGFPFNGVLPSHIVGAIALLVLAAVLLARYVFHLGGAWRGIYAIGMVVSLYFLVFVAIAQAFLKLAPLKAIAPTGTGLPFIVTQTAALAIFVVLGIAAARSFRPSRAM